MSMIGVALALAGLAFGVLLLVLRLYYGPDWAAQGVFTIFAVLFVFLGVQLIGMGLLGEYIGRISRDVQARPRYIVGARVGSRVDREPEASAAESSRVPIRSGARGLSA
jgi:undecaprenyl-phosphate 4-deoxy-4-formamido-L-arabinose transferase